MNTDSIEKTINEELAYVKDLPGVADAYCLPYVDCDTDETIGIVIGLHAFRTKNKKEEDDIYKAILAVKSVAVKHGYHEDSNLCSTCDGDGDGYSICEWIILLEALVM